MTTDFIDTHAVSGPRPAAQDLKVTESHLKGAVLAAVALVIFVLPAAAGVMALVR